MDSSNRVATYVIKQGMIKMGGWGLLGMDSSNRVATYVIKHGMIKMGGYKPVSTK